MALSRQEAIVMMSKEMHPATIVKVVEHGNLFLFQIDDPDPVEFGFDPFYSVDKNTGEVSDYSIFEGGAEVVQKFRDAP